MDESILLTVREALGVPKEYEGFDTQIIVGINSALMSLMQLGVGPSEGVTVTGITETWTDVLSVFTNIESVKAYILLKTRLLFDPPQTAHLVAAIEKQIDEIGWRLSVQSSVNSDII